MSCCKQPDWAAMTPEKRYKEASKLYHGGLLIFFACGFGTMGGLIGGLYESVGPGAIGIGIGASMWAFVIGPVFICQANKIYKGDYGKCEK